MKRLLLAAALACALLTAAAAARVASFPAPVTLDGVGGVRPGMSPAEVERRWGLRLRLDATRGTSCQTGVVARNGVRGYALFENSRFGAVFLQRGATTPSGVTIGTSERTLKRLFGPRLTVQPHQYVRGGHYYFLTRRSAPHWRIRFDTDANGRITQIAFGARAVAYVEGCA
jgi:opacity protein-like surface antigen